MGIFLKKRGDSWDPRWHGSWQVDGVRKVVALNLWRGKPPGPGEETGDAKFERSRGEAERLFKQTREGKKSAEEELVIAQKVHAARYGRKVKPVKIGELTSLWDALPGKDEVTDARRTRVHSVLGNFVKYMGEKFPRVTEVGALTREHFKGFLDAVAATGVSARTWNDNLAILRGVLAKVEGQGEGYREYLAKLKKREENTVHRRPFTEEELEDIFAAAAEVDPELRPVIVAAACTALRKGDVAKLEWDDVDLEAGFVTVKTSKTGATVEIPIFPPFAAVLAEAKAKRQSGVPYVFPRVADVYKSNPDNLDYRLRKVLAAAGFVTPDKVSAGKYEAPESLDEAVSKVTAGMLAGRWSEKRRQKGLAILQRHLQGQNGRTIAQEMRISRGGVSVYLHQMEDVGKVALVTTAAAPTPRKATLAESREGEKRARAGSLCGWHSFRTTFCTLALANGVPMEILRKITGHRTGEIVLKHYDRRGREAVRKAIGSAMPKAIAGAVEASATVTEENAPGKKTRRGKKTTTDNVETLEVVSPDVARVARMLAGATPEKLAEIEAMLKKGGSK